MTGIPENISREVPPDGGGKPRTVLFSGAGSEAGRPGRGGGAGGGKQCSRMQEEMRCFLSAQFSSTLHGCD